MIWSLQVLRFIAALMVVYVHSAQTALAVNGSIGTIPLDLAIMGRAGVDIFFVLSGVVIAKTAPGMTSAQFAWRRIRRIMPIYLVACVLILPIAIKVIGFGWRDALSTFLLWPATDVMTKPLLPVAWTLSFEMLFYFSTALVLYNRRWLYVLGGLYCLAFALRPFSPVFQFLGNPLVVEFLFGVAISRLPMWRGAVFGIPLGFAALAASGFLHIAPNGESIDFLTGQGNIQRVFVYGLPSALIVYGFAQLSARESVWTYLGDASYSLYLFHPFSQMPLHALWLIYPIQSDLIVIIEMFASVLLAWRVHALIEMPILRAIPASIRVVGTHSAPYTIERDGNRRPNALSGDRIGNDRSHHRHRA